MICKHYVDVKSIKKSTKLPDTYFVSKFGFSPYKACQHACKYCDGRSEKYYVEGDFEKDITVRQNIAEVLNESLHKFREKGIIGISSGVSDPYQPLEHFENIMPECIKAISKYNYPAMLFTKSSMIMRDIDLWEEVHHKAGFTLMMSIVFPDDQHRRHFEPYASSVSARLKTLEAFKKRGMNVGVLAMPIIPYITDTSDSLKKMVQNYKDVGADVVMPGGMTLRPGINKNTFFDVIEKHYPHLLKKYKYLYGENRQSGSPRNQYVSKLHSEFSERIVEAGISDIIPHELYKNRMSIYDEVYILMTHMIKLYDRRRVNVDNLVMAKRNYSKWLLEQKSYYNRRRNLSFQDLESKVIYMLENGELASILNNEKLNEFFRKVIIDQKTFDYRTLKLED